MRNFEIQKKNSGSFRGLGISLLFFFICFLFPIFTHASNITRAPNNLGLISYWSFNDAVGTTATDFSGRGNDLTLSNFSVTPTSLSGWTSGKIGKGLAFDGIDDIAVVSSNSFADDPSFMTISAWVKTSVVGGGNNRVIVSKNNDPATGAGWRLELNVGGSTDGSFGFYLQQAGGANYNESWTAGGYNDGKWHHVVATLGGGGGLTGTITLYVDGKDATAGNQPSGLLTTTSVALPVSIGDDGAGYRQRMVIDEVRMYNRALSASEVVSLYRSGAVVKKQANNLGLVGYWPMNEGDGTAASDFSGNRNSSLLSGDTSWVSGKLGEAVYFNEGLAGLATIPSSKVFNFENDITVSAWVKTTVDGGIIFHLQNNNPLVYLQVGDTTAGGTAHKLVAYFRTDAGGVNVTSGVTNIDDGKWHFVAAVRNIVTQDVRLYVDGSLDGSPNTYADTAAINTFGGVTNYISSTGPYGFTGTIDEVRVYNRALTVDEIASLYKTTYSLVNRTPTDTVKSGLVGYWPFDGKYTDLNDFTTEDASGNGITGSLDTGDPFSMVTLGKFGQAIRTQGIDSVSIGSSNLDLTATDKYTWSFWIKPTVFSSLKHAYSSGSFFGEDYLSISTHTTSDTDYGPCTECVSVSWRNTVGSNYLIAHTSDNVLTMNKWSHVLVTYDGSLSQSSRFVIYVDGVDVTSGGDIYSTGTIGTISPASTSIGGDPGGHVNAVIDEFRFYNRKLSAGEIAQLARP